jgi:hypothetical protein
MPTIPSIMFTIKVLSRDDIYLCMYCGTLCRVKIKVSSVITLLRVWIGGLSTTMLFDEKTVLLHAAGATEADECEKKVQTTQLWLILLIVVPTVLNLVSALLVGLTIWQVRRLKETSATITSGVHWLTRTAVRVGIGPSAKKALMQCARKHFELVKLVEDESGAFTDAVDTKKKKTK